MIDRNVTRRRFLVAAVFGFGAFATEIQPAAGPPSRANNAFGRVASATWVLS